MSCVSFISTKSHLPCVSFPSSLSHNIPSVLGNSLPSHLPCYVPQSQTTYRPSPRMTVSKALLFRASTSFAARKSVDDEVSTQTTDSEGVMEEIRLSRQFRQNGFLTGVISLTLAISIGVALNMFEPTLVLLTAAAASAYFVRTTLEYNEASHPLPDACFEVRLSQIPNAGDGLFALRDILEGEYLMDYEGEVISEIEYFQRYPTGQGRYVAEIPELIPFAGFGSWNEPSYIDGTDPSRSSLARYMNSKSMEEGGNVFWRKQRFGVRSMHFYTARDVKEGDELCFDYGANYWDAIMGENSD